MTLDAQTIGTAITAIALLATAIATFFSRQQSGIRAERDQLREANIQLKAEILIADAKLFRRDRLLRQNGIEVPGDDESPTRASRRHRRRPDDDDGSDHAAQ